MRKFIATACAFTILGFTIALANADTASDSTTYNSNNTTGTASENQAQQQPGVRADQSTYGQPQAAQSPDPYQDPYNTGNMGASAGSAATGSSSTNPSSTDTQSAGNMSSDKDNSAGSMANERTTTTRTETKWKDSKTCTDAEGVTYYRGKKGYEHCVTSAASKKNAKKDQMSGTAGNDTTSDNSVKQDAGMAGDAQSTDSSNSMNNGGSTNTDNSVPSKQ